MRALITQTFPIHDQTMFLERESKFLGLFVLAFLDRIIFEFSDMPALKADHVVMMVTPLQLEYSMSALEMMTLDQTRSFKLGQYPINRRKADVFRGVH